MCICTCRLFRAAARLSCSSLPCGLTQCILLKRCSRAILLLPVSRYRLQAVVFCSVGLCRRILNEVCRCISLRAHHAESARASHQVSAARLGLARTSPRRGLCSLAGALVAFLVRVSSPARWATGSVTRLSDDLVSL